MKNHRFISLAGLVNHLLDPHKDELFRGVYCYCPGDAWHYREGEFWRRTVISTWSTRSRSSATFTSSTGWPRQWVSTISAFMAPFGYGSAHGIDVGGEKPGILPVGAMEAASTKQAWYPGRNREHRHRPGLCRRSITTASSTSVIAERGRSRPGLPLARALRDADGEVRQLPAGRIRQRSPSKA